MSRSRGKIASSEIAASPDVVTLTFGCSDELGHDAWGDVFANLARHLLVTVGEDLYGDDAWTAADEGCSITADASRIARIRDAIEAFDGPISVFTEVHS